MRAASPLEGRLVRLRAHEPDIDLDRAHAWFNDYDVRRTLGRQYPFSRADVRTRMTDSPRYGLAPFAIVRKEDGVLIGDVGLFAMTPENRAAHLGIQIGDKSCWDGGYGTDAMRTVCRFGFDHMNLHRIDLEVLPENERARHVYRKVGFREEGVLRDAMFRRGRYLDIVLMSLLAGELTDAAGRAGES
jgi:RimJ/RimL family protein N-acetyltransferase